MNYENYEKAIVEHYGVELRNFPGGRVLQPGKLSRPLLQQLIAALEDPIEMTRCHWVALSDEQLTTRITENHARQARGEMVYKPRKKAASKTQRAVKSASVVADSSSSSDSSPEDDN
jgi:hypothetical protein